MESAHACKITHQCGVWLDLSFSHMWKNIVCDSDWTCFFFHMWKTLFAPLISKNQLAHENVQCSFSQYIYNKQLWKIFTRTYKQNDHQYPSVLFYMKWITYRTLLNKLLRPGSISLEWPYNIFSTVIIMG